MSGELREDGDVGAFDVEDRVYSAIAPHHTAQHYTTARNGELSVMADRRVHAGNAGNSGN